MAHDHLHELIGAVVAQIVFQMLGAAEIQCFRIVQRGDDVPGGAPPGHQVGGREDAGDVVGLVIGGGIGGAEAEPVGYHRHRHHDRDGVELHRAHTMLDGRGEILPVDIGHGQPVVEEGHMKFAILQRPGDALVVVRREEIRRGRRMPPGADEVRAVLRLQKGDHRHLAAGHGGFLRSGYRPPAAARAAGSHRHRYRPRRPPAPAAGRWP